VAPLPGIPDELWQLLVQCLAKAPASRLRASELAARLREQLPSLAGMGPLDVDEPGAEPEEDDEAGAAPGESAGAEQADSPEGERRVRRGAVPLVPGAKPDSNRDTHTSMRVPGPEELAGGARGTARVPRAAGAPRPGSARNRAVARRRRVTLAAVGLVLVAAAGLGAWAALSDDDTDVPPQDSNNSAPAVP
jgi:serine/threonine-protein kinase